LDVEGRKCLDIGTGSGILAVTMAKKGAEVVAADINPEALEAARDRADQEDTDIKLVESDLFENIEEEFDLIVFNPPYLPGEEGVG
ncbi:MAG: methyltransferase, partial [Candidatus Aenigmatarchaeota archaeon]